MQVEFGSESSDFFFEIIPLSPIMADKKPKATASTTNKKAWWRRPALAVATSVATIFASLYYIVTPAISYIWQDLSMRIDNQIAVKLDPMNKKLDNLLEKISFMEGQVNGFLAQKSIQDSGKYAKQGKNALSLGAAQ